MKKTYRLTDLDCANCAAKMESAIKKIEGVTEASVNFMGQRLTLAADDAVYEDVLQKALKTIKRVEPDCTVIL